VDSYRPGMQLQEYFASLGKFAHDEQNDKLVKCFEYCVWKYF
jgi:hypothetical protein